MSDSEELLFGNITDADADSDDNKSNDGTSYPQHLHTIAMDSDSDSMDRAPSNINNPIQIKKSGSKTKIKRDKSLKRIKDIAMNGSSANHDTSTVNNDLGESQHNYNNDLVDIDPSPTTKNKKFKKKGFLNGKSKRKDHHIIRDNDSDDEYDDQYDSDEQNNIFHNNNNTNADKMSCSDTLKHIMNTFTTNNHLVSLILTSIVIVTLIVSCITTNIVAVVIFIIVYIIYLVECYINKTWKDMNNKESGEDTVKLLDTLRNTPPVIDWYIECYHYETKHIPPINRKTIVWVHGKTENGHYFEELGFTMKYFKWDWNGINFVSETENQREIAAIILPSGLEGKRIQKAMMEKYHINTEITVHDVEDEKVAMQIHEDMDDDVDEDIHSDSNLPPFFRWNGNIDELLEEFKQRNVIKADKKKIVTHTNSMIYDYNEWNDISLNYPNFSKHQITKLNITKTYCLENLETRNDWNEQKQSFLSFNNKDELQSFTEKINVLGFKNCVTIRSDTESTPFWYTVHGYWIYTVFLLTLYPRYKYYGIFAIKNWKIIKSISI